MTRLSEFIVESRSEGQLGIRGFDTGYGIRRERSTDDAGIAESMKKLAERPSTIDLDCFDPSWKVSASSGSVVVSIGKPFISVAML